MGTLTQCPKACSNFNLFQLQSVLAFPMCIDILATMSPSLLSNFPGAQLPIRQFLHTPVWSIVRKFCSPLLQYNQITSPKDILMWSCALISRAFYSKVQHKQPIFTNIPEFKNIFPTFSKALKNQQAYREFNRETSKIVNSQCDYFYVYNQQTIYNMILDKAYNTLYTPDVDVTMLQTCTSILSSMVPKGIPTNGYQIQHS